MLATCANDCALRSAVNGTWWNGMPEPFGQFGQVGMIADDCADRGGQFTPVGAPEQVDQAVRFLAHQQHHRLGRGGVGELPFPR